MVISIYIRANTIFSRSYSRDMDIHIIVSGIDSVEPFSVSVSISIITNVRHL